MLKVSGYDLKEEYPPGKKQVLADTLSWASLNDLQADEDKIQVNMLERISISEPKYAELQQKLQTNSMGCTLWFERSGQKQNNRSHTASENTGSHVMNLQF